jgi:hypothetical protein
MKNDNIKFEQLPIAIGEDERTNYLVVVEVQNGHPRNTFLVSLHNFLFWDEKMKHYVINAN